MPQHVRADVLGDLGPLCRRSDVIPLDGFRPKWLATLHPLTGKNPILISSIRRLGTPSQQVRKALACQIDTPMFTSKNHQGNPRLFWFASSGSHGFATEQLLDAILASVVNQQQHRPRVIDTFSSIQFYPCRHCHRK